MAITRTFLDWREPALPAVAEYLVNRFRRDRTLNLDQVLLVLPGGRAARQLMDLLVLCGEQRALVLFPPETSTVGGLPEYLYESHRPFADALTQQLAWVQALKTIDRHWCREFIPQVPAEEDYAGWMDLGALLQRQHRELAADALDFAEVARRGVELPGFQETDRWTFFSQVQKDYLGLLDELELWDRQTARLYAIDHQICRTDKEIVLIGTTDMTIAMRRMIDQVADHVTALVHAPESLADSFDEHGCLIPDRWLDKPIGIETGQMRVVEGPVEQGREMVRALAAFNGRYRADQIVIGVLDEGLVPHLLRQLEESEVSGRWVVGRAVWETAPYRLLEAVARCVDRDRFLDFACLVRHPDVSRWLNRQVASEDWLVELDEYYSEHLQPRLGNWLDDSSRCSIKRVVSLVHEALQPLRGSKRPLAQWAPALARLLDVFYGDRTFNVEWSRDLYTLRALEQMRETLLLYQEIPSKIDFPLTAGRAITQLLGQIAHSEIPSPHQGGEIELLGWLELPLDMAPALIVTGFNEGNVPTSVNSDLFLPNQLRRQLGLVDNRRRYARDAYALSVLGASRENLTLIAGRFTADHDPLAPSRLAFAADAETVARRALCFFTEPATSEPGGNSIIPGPLASEKSGLVVPKPTPLSTPITSISATSFRTYMECPYRFYLRHVLALETIADTDEELDGAAYGTLIHEVLKQFGQHPIRESKQADDIDRFLRDALDRIALQRLGADRLPTVDVQIAQARQRLKGFAHWQARRAQEGWEIVYVETCGGTEPARLNIDAETSVLLKGRIDRIDRRGKQWAILDYKTGDTAKSPQETHVRSGEWIDLQLPLYAHLARTLELDGSLQLGYVLLPKEMEQIGASMAEWDDAMLESADERALEVARDIVAERFWPPAVPPSGSVTDFAAICQEHAFRPHLAEAEDSNEP
ncbi:MAG: PD-(D/E)XK nuclease family protein [Planctomycetota bacterium]